MLYVPGSFRRLLAFCASNFASTELLNCGLSAALSMLSLLGSNTASQRLLRAVGKGDVRTIEDCLWLESLDAQTSKQRSLVAVAAAAGQYAALTLLLSKGAKPNTVDVGGDTPLHTVGSAQCATRLLEYGAAFEAKNGKGQTANTSKCCG